MYFSNIKNITMVKLRNLIILVLIVSASSLFSQLSGVAFLSNQSNHAGIKVKFIANSQTAVTDSTLTNATGNYSINISGGVYLVEISKMGYQTNYYNNNTAVLLTNTTVLNNVTLLAGNIVFVSGNVSGNWTNNNTYIVTGDITIANGNTLNIQSGTNIRFSGNYSLTANGVLIADGSNGNQIVFTSNSASPTAGDWSGIYIYSSLSNLTNCLVEYAEYAVTCNSSNPIISSNEITNFYVWGISTDSSPTIKGNKVHDYYALYYGVGINLIGGSSLVECNEVYNGSGYGIRPLTTCTVKNNIVTNISDPQRGFGIGLTLGSPRLENNIISGCQRGIMVSGANSLDATPLIINNTVYNNIDGMMLGWASDCFADAVITNNIIVNNTNGINIGCGAGTASVISYNCLWNNSNSNYNNVQIVGLGQIVSNNSNGDPIDSYFNISKDPLFVGGIPPYLNSGSPCFGAGDNAFSPNIGCNPSLICSNIILGVKENKKESEFKIFPNPFKDDITITYKMINGKIKVKLFDPLGKEVKVMNTFSEGELKIETLDLKPRIYFLQLTSDNSKQTIKLIKN